MDNSKAFLNTEITQQEYLEYLSKTDTAKYKKSDASEIERIEDLLGVRRGILKGEDYYVDRKTCNCGKDLTFYDFVSTALSESSHSQPFLVHALLGNKYGFQTPRTVTCSACGEVHPNSTYKTPNYSCREGGVI